MRTEEIYESIKQKNLYDILCKAEQHFVSLPLNREAQEESAPRYAFIVSACRVLEERKLEGMSVEQFRKKHELWYREVVSALTDVINNHELSLKLSRAD